MPSLFLLRNSRSLVFPPRSYCMHCKNVTGWMPSRGRISSLKKVGISTSWVSRNLNPITRLPLSINVIDKDSQRLFRANCVKTGVERFKFFCKSHRKRFAKILMIGWILLILFNYTHFTSLSTYYSLADLDVTTRAKTDRFRIELDPKSIRFCSG